MTRPYVDPTTGEYVAEHETRDATTGEIQRQTEWFANLADAERFARTGPTYAERVRAMSPAERDTERDRARALTRSVWASDQRRGRAILATLKGETS